MNQKDCFICRKHLGEVNIPGGAILNNELVYVGHIGIGKNNDNYLGHIMLDLKRHVKGVDEMTNEEAAHVGIVVKHVAAGLKSCFDVEHVYVQIIGDNVPHLHIHIIPRYKNSPKKFWGSEVKKWDDAPRGGETEVESICSKLREYLTVNI